MELKIITSGSTALKGIPDTESDSQVCQDPPAEAVSLPWEGAAKLSGDEQSVFTSLVMMEPEGPTDEVGDSPSPSNKMGVSMKVASSVSSLVLHPNVSCRINPTGDTILSITWSN